MTSLLDRLDGSRMRGPWRATAELPGPLGAVEVLLTL